MHQHEHWTCTSSRKLLCLYVFLKYMVRIFFLSLLSFPLTLPLLSFFECVDVPFFRGGKIVLCTRMYVLLLCICTHSHIYSLCCNNDAYKIGKYRDRERFWHERGTHRRTSFRWNLFFYIFFRWCYVYLLVKWAWMSLCVSAHIIMGSVYSASSIFMLLPLSLVVVQNPILISLCILLSIYCHDDGRFSVLQCIDVNNI